MSTSPAAALPVSPRWWPRWPGWRHLPRDARDTLFLLAVIGWTVLPHVTHLPLWASLLVGVVLVWRARLALAAAALPSRWLLVAILLGALVATQASFGSLLGKEPGVALAVVLMGLKTLELRARRDAFVVFFLGFFIILTHFLYSQSLAVAVAMLVSVWGLLTAVVLAHMPVGTPRLAQAGGLALRTSLFGAPVMALLFVLFPRLGPLWGVPQDGISTTGLSNTMRLGSLSRVARDDAIAMRVRFLDRPPAQSELYFRGPVLTIFDGSEWRPMGLAYAAPGSPPRPPALQTSTPPLRYEITLEPLRLASVPLLEATTDVKASDELRLSPREDLQWLAERPLLERVRFDAVAQTGFTLGQARYLGGLQEARTLPSGYNPRTVAWAQALRAEPRLRGADARAFADAVLQHIRDGGYDYTLAPGEYGRDAVDEFWLDRKTGFCEHFAASFVVVMRAIGVPARIVTGYQGADTTLVDGYYIVRQSAAHAWAEYWQPGIGWIHADPTAAVAPDRIGSGSQLLPQPGLIAGAIGTMSPALLANLRNGWEAINNRWNQWVLSYSRGSQLELLKSLGYATPSWEDVALLLTSVLSAVAAAGALWAWLDRHRTDPWARQLAVLRRSLRALGVAAAEHEPPQTLALRVRHQLGAAGNSLAALLEALDRQRYAPGAASRPDPRLTREFVARARSMRVAAS